MLACIIGIDILEKTTLPLAFLWSVVLCHLHCINRTAFLDPEIDWLYG